MNDNIEWDDDVDVLYHTDEQYIYITFSDGNIYALDKSESASLLQVLYGWLK